MSLSRARACGISLISCCLLFFASCDDILDEFKYKNDWVAYGGSGSGAGQFSNPNAVTVDAEGRIYVVDVWNGRIVRIDDMSGAGWITLKPGGTAIGIGTGIAFDSSGRMYISSSYNDEIIRMDDMRGTGWTTLQSCDEGTLDGPEGIAIDGADRIYVAEEDEGLIVRVDDMSGAGWIECGMESLDGIAVDAEGRIYSMEEYGERVVRMDDMSGTGLIKFDIWNDANEYFRADAFAVDAQERLYFVGDDIDWDYKMARMDDMSGEGWVTIGTAGNGEYQFNGFGGIVVDDAGQIIISDPENDRIVRFSGV